MPAGLPPLASPLDASPLDALASDPGLAAGLSEGGPLGPPPPERRISFSLSSRNGASGVRRRRRKMPWVWIGTAAAVLLVLVVVSVWLLNRPNPEALLDPADTLYQKGSYAEAVEGYNGFLKYFPRHAQYDARVRRGLAELRLVFDEKTASSGRPGDGETGPARDRSRDGIRRRGRPPFFSSCCPGPPSRWPWPPDNGLSPESIAQAEEMFSLADRYLPAATKPLERLGRIEASLALTRHKAAGEDELGKAIAAMGQAAAAKNLAEAYRVRNALLDAYPDMSQHADLTGAVLKIALAEQAAVAWVAKPEPAGKRQPAGPSSTVVLAARTFKSDAPDAEGRVVFAAAAGAVYALDAANGKVLWRKYVGFDPCGRATRTCPPPHAATGQRRDPGRRFAPRGPRLQSATGRTSWRHPIDDDFSAEPVVADGRVLVATLGGRLVMIDAATGESAGLVQLPQPLPHRPGRRSALAISSSRRPTTTTCSSGDARLEMPPGFSARAWARRNRAPPLVFGDYLLVAVNDTAANSSLRVLGIKSGASRRPRHCDWCRPSR